MIARTRNAVRWLMLPLLAGCAHVEAPPGGRADQQAPRVIAVRPDTVAVVPGFRSEVVIRFDERLSETGLENAVTVSPRTSPAEIDVDGNEIRVSLSRGWEPGRIYQINVAPTLQDRFRNRIPAPVQVTISTGPAIPNTLLLGTVRDRVTGQPEIGARVEALAAGESSAYVTTADSAGRFRFARIPAGRYGVRAYDDLNRNRRLDLYEDRDTASSTVTPGDSVRLRLALLAPDSTPPAVASARLQGNLLEITFDDPLDPTQALLPEQVQIVSTSGRPVAVRRLAVGQLPAAADTARRRTAADSGRAGTPRPDATATPGQPRRDTIVEILPAPRLSVEPADTIAGDTLFRISVQGVRNLVGLVGGGETRLRVAPPRPLSQPATPPAGGTRPPASRDSVPQAARPTAAPDSARRPPR